VVNLAVRYVDKSLLPVGLPVISIGFRQIEPRNNCDPCFLCGIYSIFSLMWPISECEWVFSEGLALMGCEMNWGWFTCLGLF
jgi:hypothetical protein